MRRREGELSVVRKPQDLWIITLKIETALSKLMEVPCKVVLPCTLFPKFALWNVFICNSNLGVWLWVTSSYFFKQSLFTWLYAWWPFGHRKTCWCALKSKWIHHPPPPYFHPSPCGSCWKFVFSRRKDHRKNGMLLSGECLKLMA